MLIDPLPCELENLPIHAQVYTDDVAVLAVDRDLGTVCRNTQGSVDLIDSWCLRHGLSVNPNKTTMVLFTKRRKLNGLCLPEMRGTTLQLSEEVKYLGVTLDKKLLWNKHVEEKMNGVVGAQSIERVIGGLNPVLAIPSDSRVPIHLFGRRYEVTLKRREDWEDPEECVAGYTEVFYTDGSKTEEGSGARVYLSNKSEKWTFPLGQYATVFQAEVYAILRAANWVIDERLKGRRVAICSDSQAALRALSSPLITSKIVQECRNRLNSYV